MSKGRERGESSSFEATTGKEGGPPGGGKEGAEWF